MIVLRKKGLIVFLICGLFGSFLYLKGRVFQASLNSTFVFDYFDWKYFECLKTKTIEHTFKENETLYEVLINKYNVPTNLIYNELDQKIKEFLPIKKIRPDDKIYLTFFQDSLKEITFSPSPEKKYSFIITPFGIKSYVKTVTSYSFLTKAQGKIKKNLYESALEQNIDPKLILELADIFGWDINFFTDIRPGDSYQFMYEKIYVNGKFLRVGQILAAEFINQNHCFKAYYFKIPNGQGEYYDPKGRPLRKTFLKSPLRYKRISSCFSYHRRHPILGIVRPHLGIDYAASIGTPVESVGDGRIIYIGWKGGYGKFIKIRHNHRYVSTYGHLSRFAKGLKTGSLVKQGEVIGYVGSTGLSTGPHLDFRFLANNKFIDYLKFNSPPNPPLSQKYYPAFKKELTYYKHLLEGPVYQVQLKMEKTGS